jgi:hypothetical protein
MLGVTATDIHGNEHAHSDLSTLSLDAAIELDNLLRREKVDHSKINRLALALETASGFSENQGALKLQADPLTIDVFDKALVSAGGPRYVNIEELGSHLKDLISIMQHADKDLERREIEATKSFCISLHDVLISQLSVSEDSDDYQQITFI